jgi:hypothetical protein
MKFHFLFKEQESDIYSKGVNNIIIYREVQWYIN